jgi:uncharacterized RDD family membrane protein YckC
MIEARVPYAGVATRAVALGVDGLVSQGIYVIGAALVGLAASIAGELRPEWLVASLAALGWALTVATYFAGFWTVTGQTPGMRLMGLRVERAEGGPLHLPQALLRLVGLIVSIIPLFAGFIPVLFDDRRRGLPDMLAGTVVRYVVPEEETVVAPVIGP